VHQRRRYTQLIRSESAANKVMGEPLCGQFVRVVTLATLLPVKAVVLAGDRFRRLATDMGPYALCLIAQVPTNPAAAPKRRPLYTTSRDARE